MEKEGIQKGSKGRQNQAEKVMNGRERGGGGGDEEKEEERGCERGKGERQRKGEGQRQREGEIKIGEGSKEKRGMK